MTRSERARKNSSSREIVGTTVALDAVEAIGALRLVALLREQAAESLLARPARVLHVDHDEGHARGIEGKARVELRGVVIARRWGATVGSSLGMRSSSFSDGLVSRPDGSGWRPRCAGP